MKSENVVLIFVLIAVCAVLVGGYFAVFSADQISISNVPDVRADIGETISITGDAHTDWTGYYEIQVTSPSGSQTVVYTTWLYAPFDTDWTWSGEYTVSELGTHTAQIYYYNRDPKSTPQSTLCIPQTFDIASRSTTSSPDPTPTPGDVDDKEEVSPTPETPFTDEQTIETTAPIQPVQTPSPTISSILVGIWTWIKTLSGVI